MNPNEVIGKRISELRRGAGLSQETLADKLGITSQAVSKWETGLSCPDISLLPQIADLFGISIDGLFGRVEKTEAVKKTDTGKSTMTIVPWEDDNEYRAVLFLGTTYVSDQVLSADRSVSQNMTVKFDGCVRNLTSAFAVKCQDVAGNVTVSGDLLSCGDVGGFIKVGGMIRECGDVCGSIEAGGNVNCDNVGENVRATGGDVNCDGVGGNVTAAVDVACNNVSGNVTAGFSVTCDSVHGNVNVQETINCDTVEGDVYANTVYCEHICGNVRDPKENI